MTTLRWLAYEFRRWFLKRTLRVIAYRREELDHIVRRERAILDYEEHATNSRLRDLQTRNLHSRLVKVRP